MLGEVREKKLARLSLSVFSDRNYKASDFRSVGNLRSILRARACVRNMEKLILKFGQNILKFGQDILKYGQIWDKCIARYLLSNQLGMFLELQELLFARCFCSPVQTSGEHW